MPPNGSYLHSSSVSLDGSHVVYVPCVAVVEAEGILCWGGCAVMKFVVGMEGIWMFAAIMLCVEEGCGYMIKALKNMTRRPRRIYGGRSLREATCFLAAIDRSICASRNEFVIIFFSPLEGELV